MTASLDTLGLHAGATASSSTARAASPTHDPLALTSTSTTSARTSALALNRPRAGSAAHSLPSLAAADGLQQQQQKQPNQQPSPAKQSVHRASSSSINTTSLSSSANKSALPRHGSQLLNTSLTPAQLRKSASALALAFASDFAAASATPALAHQKLRARSRANLAASPAASTLELDRILTAVESQLLTADKTTTIKLADPIVSTSTSPTLRIAPPPPLQPSDPRALPRTASFLLQVTLGEARFPPFQVAPAADARRGTTVGGAGPVGKKRTSIAAAAVQPGLGAPKLLRPPGIAPPAPWTAVTTASQVTAWYVLSLHWCEAPDAAARPVCHGRSRFLGTPRRQTTMPPPLLSTTTLGSADVSPTDPGSTRRPSISFAGLSPLADDSTPTSPSPAFLRFRGSGSTASGGIGGSSTLVSPMTPLGFLPHGPGPHAHLITFRHKDSSSSIASRAAALTLKDEIYKLLPHPVPRSFYKFYMSQECDLFLKHGVQYLDLYLRHKKAQLAAESKVGLDQLKRLYMAQLASLPETDPPAPTADACDPTVSLNDSAAMRGTTPTTAESPTTTAPAEMDVHALALSQEARESLKADRDAAMHRMCQGYARIVQRYGAAMNFAVERSFYECFYSMLGEHFRAHVPTPEWPSVRTHLESIFQAHFPASRAPAPGSAPPNRTRTSVSAAASAAAAALGTSPTAAARLASRAAPGEERRASLATDALGHRVLRAHSTAAMGGGAAAVAMALDGLGASMAHLTSAAAVPTVMGAGVGVPVASAAAVGTGGGKLKVRAQHEVMDVIERAIERKRIEDGKQREREARRKLEAAHSARDTFSLRSVIHARSPLLAQAMPTARDQTHRVLEQSKVIMQATTQARVDLSQRQRTRRGRGRPAPELGTSVDLVEDPPAVRRHALVAERKRAGRSPSRAAARIASASASAAAAAVATVVVAVDEPVVPSPPSRRATGT
ncbi:hypothetical protein GGF31_004769 [Allomyces arbusculus]|nr:hypothetical protein GGF31_004769 [Allomyces arbusculus]